MLNSEEKQDNENQNVMRNTMISSVPININLGYSSRNNL